MFFDIFSALCKKKGVTPNKALTDCEISRTSVAKWKKGAVPNGATLSKLAAYFGVTTDYLMGISIQAQIDGTEYRLAELRADLKAAKSEEERIELLNAIEVVEESYKDLILLQSLTVNKQKEAPALTKKDERDIGRDLERIMENLEGSGDLMFDGVPMSQEAIDSLKSAMKLGLEAVKLRNKETYTPKKYRRPKEE